MRAFIALLDQLPLARGAGRGLADEASIRRRPFASSTRSAEALARLSRWSDSRQKTVV